MTEPPLVGYGQLCLSSDQIARFFDHQYIWKESRDILVLLHVVNHQVKVASEMTTFSLLWPVLPLAQSDCKIL